MASEQCKTSKLTESRRWLIKEEVDRVRERLQTDRQPALLAAAQSREEDVTDDGLRLLPQAKLGQKRLDLCAELLFGDLAGQSRQARVVLHVRRRGEEPMEAIILRHESLGSNEMDWSGATYSEKGSPIV